MFRENGIIVSPDDFQPFVGMGENRYIGGVAQKYGLKTDIEQIKARTYEIYELITRGKLVPLPGAKEFINKCISRGLKLALATSADRIKMEVNLRETGISLNLFQASVNGLDVERKKPFPDIYLKASNMIGIRPDECLVVEDAVSGIKAGKSAGCRCLGLTTSFDRDALGEADWICNNLSDAPDEAINW
jgi:HAD superfamily hydrolase (TIGR01509 family)